MAGEEIAGYLILGGYGLLLVAAVRRFGLGRVLGVLFGIVTLGLVIALGTLRGMTSRRY